jgi:hypothetical protein
MDSFALPIDASQCVGGFLDLIVWGGEPFSINDAEERGVKTIPRPHIYAV